METNTKRRVNRRNFLRTGAGAIVLSSVAVPAMRGNSDNKLNRLACNSWPFRTYFDTPELHEYRKPEYSLLTQPEFPEFLADHFGIHNVEFLPQHFADTEKGTIDKVKAGLKKAKSTCCNLMGVDIPGGVFTKGLDREKVVQTANRWVGVAVALGSPSVTVALNGHGPADPRIAAENLKPFAEVTQSHGVKLLFHNDSMKTESAEILTSAINQLGHNRVGTCPDFGNFAPKSAAYALSQLKMLAPYASNICHAKDGLASNGKFYTDDFPASMKVMHDSGFHGIYSLEFEGLEAPIEGVKNLLGLTEKYMS
jgi:sugar phosphate isomerase/epimerase